MKKKLIKSKGILFWITGLSGSGKSTIAKLLKPKIIKKYGPTIIFHGDDLRNILNFQNYTLKGRLNNGLIFTKLFKFITNQKINVIFAGVGMFHKLRKFNRSSIKNYLEIYIKTDIRHIILVGKKKIYQNKKNKIVGKNLKAEFPKKPDIILDNNFKKLPKKLANELFIQIKDKI